MPKLNILHAISTPAGLRVTDWSDAGMQIYYSDNGPWIIVTDLGEEYYADGPWIPKHSTKAVKSPVDQSRWGVQMHMDGQICVHAQNPRTDTVVYSSNNHDIPVSHYRFMHIAGCTHDKRNTRVVAFADDLIIHLAIRW